MVKIKYGGLLLAVAAVGTFATGATAGAQAPSTQTEPSAASSEPRLEEITVSAQRRAERLQDVPITVTAFTASQLDARQASATLDLLQTVPGVVVLANSAGVGNATIRGVGNLDTTPGNEAGVATYVDGVYMYGVDSSIFSLSNVKSLEILKGPQGTLFGRNATGGAINVYTRDPSSQASLEGSLSYGNYQTVEGTLYATGGTDSVAADISGHFITQGEGYGRNVYTGGRTNYFADSALRSKVVFQPSEADKFTIIGNWGSNKDVFSIARQLVSGSLGVQSTPRRGGDFDTVGSFNPNIPESDSFGLSLHWEHDLGWAKMAFLSAYNNTRITFSYDNDLIPTVNLSTVNLTERWNWFQDEWTLTGTVGRLKYTGGFFYLSANGGDFPLAPTGISPTSNTSTVSYSPVNSYAGYFQGTYAATDTTNVTVGARYTVDDRELIGQVFAAPGYPAPAGTVLQSRIASARYGDPTWRFAVDQKLTPDILLYASYNRGFKSGIFATNSLTNPPVKPERIDSYEVGVKSEVAQIVRANLSAFLYDYKNVQLTEPNPIGVGKYLLNAATARGKGIDADVAVAPPIGTGRLQFDGGVSLLSARYTAFPGGPVAVPLPTGGNNTISADLSGNQMILAPKWTVNFLIGYSIDLGPGEFGLNATYYHNSGFYWEPDNRLRQDPYNEVNANVRYSFGRDNRYTVRVWGKNLTHAVFYTFQNSNPLGDAEVGAVPLTCGIAFDFKL